MDCWAFCLTVETVVAEAAETTTAAAAVAVAFIFSEQHSVDDAPRAMVAGSTTRLKLLGGFISYQSSNSRLDC